MPHELGYGFRGGGVRMEGAPPGVRIFMIDTLMPRQTGRHF